MGNCKISKIRVIWIKSDFRLICGYFFVTEETMIKQKNGFCHLEHYKNENRKLPISEVFEMKIFEESNLQVFLDSLRIFRNFRNWQKNHKHKF
jgi:hypothetical protein